MYKDFLYARNKKEKNPWYKLVLKIIKFMLYGFLFISMLWGCSQMYIPKYGTFQIVDATGQSVYKSGVLFEFIFSFFNQNKLHIWHFYNNQIYEYPYLSIGSWAQAFRVTQSPFYGIFVYPVSFILVAFISLFGGVKNYSDNNVTTKLVSGPSVIFSILLISIIVRMITFGFSWKLQVNQDKMQILQLKQAEIKAKYKEMAQSKELKRKQQMEIMQLYKKEKVSPFSAVGSIFLSGPFLFALYVAIRSTRALKSARVGSIFLINTPFSSIGGGHYIYILLLVFYLPVQVTSMLLPMFLNWKKASSKTTESKKARKKQLIMQGVITLVFFVIVGTIASGVAIYWIFSGFLQIVQTLFIHYLLVWKQKRKRVKIIKLKETWKKQKSLLTSNFLSKRKKKQKKHYQHTNSKQKNKKPKISI